MSFGPRVKRRRDGGFRLILPWLEALVLRSLPARLQALLSDPAGDGKLAARIFPRAYEDPAREAEFRKLVGEDLRRRKLESASAFRKSLEAWTMKGLDVVIEVPAEGVDDWLCFVNDMRLVLGVETGILTAEDEEPLREDPDDPRAADLAMLHYLSWIEEKVVEALSRE